MRILYGVQATGLGHISRARAIGRALAHRGAEVTWLFSGRPREQLHDMQPFGDYLHRRGLSFATRDGGILYLRTIWSNNLGRFVADARQLDLAPYDLIVSDFEPVTAWAAKLAGRLSIGIGHQYAFGPGSPISGGTWWNRLIMRHFAPVTIPLGLHWHPYSSNVLPPVLDLPVLVPDRRDHILVYLPFEDQERVTAWLQQFPRHNFKQYAAGVEEGIRGNVSRYGVSVHGFKAHLAGSKGVICNSGFELISECLHWGKRVLTKPVAGQVEQLSNALALQQLGYARVIHSLDREQLADWLHAPDPPSTLAFPDVAGCLAAWLANGCAEPPEELSRRLWLHHQAGARAGQPTVGQRMHPLARSATTGAR